MINLLTEASLLALAKSIYYRKEGTSVVLPSMSPSFLPNLAMLRSYVVKLVLYRHMHLVQRKPIKKKTAVKRI